MSYSMIRRLAEERIAAVEDEIRERQDEVKLLRKELAELVGPSPAETKYVHMTYGEAILQYLREVKGPRSTKQVIEALEAGGKSPSQGTAYNTLRRLCDDEKVGWSNRRWQAMSSSAES